LGKYVKVRCKCGKEGHYKKDCKSKTPKKGKGYDDSPSVEVKNTSNEGGDVYLASSSSTHVDHEPWLIDLVASFDFTPLLGEIQLGLFFCKKSAFYGAECVVECAVKCATECKVDRAMEKFWIYRTV